MACMKFKSYLVSSVIRMSSLGVAPLTDPINEARISYHVHGTRLGQKSSEREVRSLTHFINNPLHVQGSQRKRVREAGEAIDLAAAAARGRNKSDSCPAGIPTAGPRQSANIELTPQDQDGDDL
ncbi:hypothetical protein NDA11_001255 [Ustilago hordei]|uniref:Uncharacterized protein n=1 Tax=Ustilago hordei TaxID=120017 RepID=I2G1R4_USTHO|nr:uncharacterized protein UHO2_02422 [Ustilago hordei]KAJ1040088.1 hypothetical protein NDA10_000930 [Ustilago hordei]KAJ1585533.1 hypothetical protein NDA15_007117 [Ustilago hordei]KAJ1588199.1 hypothetical protein NDA12_004954 [Ustilago hordei]KAJ1592744.1 hypothetical protein NDA11_001255 [Ustilago hordei]KAJ1601734.1 hypothetical protein NDA14_005866 [Ustilago hordei]